MSVLKGRQGRDLVILYAHRCGNIEISQIAHNLGFVRSSEDEVSVSCGCQMESEGRVSRIRFAKIDDFLEIGVFAADGGA